MDVLRDVLEQVRNGKRDFTPDGDSRDEIIAFQEIAEALVHANDLGYLECLGNRESDSGERLYSMVIVTSGLTYPGQQYLGEARTQARVQTNPTGWSKIDRNVRLINTQLNQATVEVEFQQVGHLCRETLIDLGQEVFNAELHVSADGTTPSNSDAKGMLDRYLTVELRGGSNAEARKHAQAALTLANALTHKRTAGFRDAALCAEATASIVNIVAIISGLRDPSGRHAS